MAYFVEATYIHTDGCRFDFDHYANVHIPLSEKQMAKGSLSFAKRILKKNTVNLFTGEPIHQLSLIYVLEDEREIEAFKAFMQTEHVAPLMEDTVKYTDCELLWSVGELSEM